MARSRSAPASEKASSTSPASSFARTVCLEISEVNVVAFREALLRTRQRTPTGGIDPPQQIETYARRHAGPFAPAFERCRNDARIVEYERIAGLKTIHEISDMRIMKRRHTAGIDDEHAGAISGSTGSSAMALSGSSKSKRSVFMGLARDELSRRLMECVEECGDSQQSPRPDQRATSDRRDIGKSGSPRNTVEAIEPERARPPRA